MNKKQGILFTKALLVVLIASCLVSCFMCFWLKKNPVWQEEGISFIYKLKIACNTTFILPFGRSFVFQIYSLQTDKDVTFTAIAENIFLSDGYKQELYYKGNLVSWVYFDEIPKNKNIKISIFHLISTENGHYWLLRYPDESDDLVLWCDLNYTHFTGMDTENLARSIIKYGDGVFTYRGEMDTLLPVALDSAYTSGDWQSFMLLSDLLLQCNKSKYANIVNRYATGFFSSREKSQNAQSKITEDAVVAYAKQMKAKYKL